MIARVRGEIACAARRGSMFSVSGSTSTNTGFAPTCSITFAVAVNVIGVVITSSPEPISRQACAPGIAAVPEVTPRAAAVRGAGRDPGGAPPPHPRGDLFFPDERRIEGQEFAPRRPSHDVGHDAP